MSVLLIGCSQKEETSSLVSSPKVQNNAPEEAVVAELSFINVYSSKTSFVLGESVGLMAIGYFSDGSFSDVTGEVIWTSLDETKVSLSGNDATAVSSGSVVISASLNGKSNSIVLLPFSATIVALDINYQSLTIPQNTDSQLIVSAIYDNGQSTDVTMNSTFSMVDETIATITSEGMISSLSPGSTNLSISYEGESKVLPITVSSASITDIQVTPIIGSKPIGSEQQFYVTATLDNGSTIDVTNSATWSSGNSSLIELDNSGLADLKAAGSTTVSASYQSYSSSVNFEVLNKNIVSIDLNLSTSSLALGASTSVTCFATYSDSTTEDITELVTFSSSDNSIAAVSNNEATKGVINPIAVGTSDITAIIGAFSSSETLAVTNANLVSITVSTPKSLLSSSINAYFTAIGNYDDSTSVDITQSVSWSLSNNSYGSILNSGVDKGLFTNTFNGASTTNLTVTATLAGISNDFTILLAPGTISSISINPSSATLNLNQNADFKAYAHFSDGASVEITDIVMWATGDETISLVSNSMIDAGRVSALAEGVTTVVASYNGMISSSSNLLVDDSVSSEIPDEGTGLLASYYTGNNFDTLKGQRIDSQLFFNWATGSAPLGVGDNFSVRWTGKIKGKVTGDCTIASRSDDGFRMWIGGVSIIDVWSPHAPRWDYNYSVSFVEGEKQDITVEFFENGGHAVSELYWQCPGDGALTAIPMENLFPE